MQIKGSVEEVIYRNVENGYSVIALDSNYQIITCVGIFPLVTEGEDLILEGDWILDKKFGKQFSVKTAQIELPTSQSAMIKYLSSGLFRGVGVATATKIVEKFKDDTIEVLSCAPRMLSTIKSISFQKALEIVEDFNEHRDMQNVVMYLQGYDISINIAIKLYKAYGKNVRTILEENPYRLVLDIEGIGFLTADKIAQKIGIAADSKYRIRAAITYLLTDAANSLGNTFVYYDQLVLKTSELLQLDYNDYMDQIQMCIKESEDNDNIIVLEDNDKKIVMAKVYYNMEKSIARKIVSLINSNKNTYFTDIDLDIKTFQMLNNIELHENQIEAIKSCLNSGVNVITGGPGTGKTTIIKAVLHILLGLRKTFALCAPTGRAAKRLTEATGYEAKTIHRLLEISFSTGKPEFIKNESNKLEADVVIVDEVSMCDEFIFYSLIKAVKNGARVILLGDKDQLPSVGAGNLLADLINSKVVPINYLTQIFRQKEGSMIVYNAHAINNGRMPQIDNKSTDFFFEEMSSQQDILNTTIELVTKRIPKYFKVGKEDVQILCPVKKNLVGVENINAEMQKIVNPFKGNENEIKIGTRVLRVGDRIIHTENNYQLDWINETDSTVGKGIFNGDMGYISSINPKRPSITISFDDGKLATYTSADFDQLSLAYAISIHKSQGSEFKVVVIALGSNNAMLMTRNLIYTGITRAKEVVVIVGAKQTLSKMIANNLITKRNSKLLDFIQEEAVFNLDE